MIGGMKTIMNAENLNTIEQLTRFLEGTLDIAFSIFGDNDERYRWLQKNLAKFDYMSLSKQDKGIVIQYLRKISGYSRQQLTRLIKQYRDKGVLRRRQRTIKGFHRLYTDRDIQLLADMDERHDAPSGPTVKKLCERAFNLFGETEYERLTTISVAHLYNLRHSNRYQKSRRYFQKTRSKKAQHIGQRRKPFPNGQPGYLRVDTVHQGDLDRQKGVYHINLVDEVTQFEMVISVEKISEWYLLPALEWSLENFPFILLGFHSDNGSEYINSRVAGLLQKLLIEFTKSRARHSNDNALVEGKNAAIVRKIFGYEHIPQYFAPLINEFNQNYLNTYINYHRPCYFPVTVTDKKGKERKRYPYESMMTPYEKLKSLDNAKEYLKPGLSFEILDTIAYQMSDNVAAEQLQEARRKLFKSIHERDRKQA